MLFWHACCKCSLYGCTWSLTVDGHQEAVSFAVGQVRYPGNKGYVAIMLTLRMCLAGPF